MYVNKKMSSAKDDLFQMVECGSPDDLRDVLMNNNFDKTTIKQATERVQCLVRKTKGMAEFTEKLEILRGY
jgi:hypothetical protein